MVTEAEVLQALKPIEDPELHLGIVELGLIYAVAINESPAGGDVKVRMTLTSPFCPYGPMLRSQVQQTVAKLPGVAQAQIEVVFTPPWDPRTMASEDVKMALGIGWDEGDGSAGPEGEIESQR